MSLLFPTLSDHDNDPDASIFPRSEDSDRTDSAISARGILQLAKHETTGQ